MDILDEYYTDIPEALYIELYDQLLELKFTDDVEEQKPIVKPVLKDSTPELIQTKNK